MKQLFSIFDDVAQEFGQPFLSNNDESAKRIAFNSFGNDDKLHVEDYTLYCVGSFDVESAVIVPSVHVVCPISDLFINEELKSHDVQQS